MWVCARVRTLHTVRPIHEIPNDNLLADSKFINNELFLHPTQISDPPHPKSSWIFFVILTTETRACVGHVQEVDKPRNKATLQTHLWAEDEDRYLHIHSWHCTSPFKRLSTVYSDAEWRIIRSSSVLKRERMEGYIYTSIGSKDWQRSWSLNVGSILINVGNSG